MSVSVDCRMRDGNIVIVLDGHECTPDELPAIFDGATAIVGPNDSECDWRAYLRTLNSAWPVVDVQVSDSNLCLVDIETTTLVPKGDDLSAMEISVACAEWRGERRSFRFIGDRKEADMKKLAEWFDAAEGIVALNGVRFDFRVFANYYDVTPWLSKIVDVSGALHRYYGFDGRIGRHYIPVANAAALSRENGIAGKSGKGSDAPEMWESGRYDDLIWYCHNDVRLMGELHKLPFVKFRVRNQLWMGSAEPAVLDMASWLKDRDNIGAYIRYSNFDGTSETRPNPNSPKRRKITTQTTSQPSV
jgi:hypothetical protein